MFYKVDNTVITITSQLSDQKKKLMKHTNSVQNSYMLGIYKHSSSINPQIHIAPFKFVYH